MGMPFPCHSSLGSDEACRLLLDGVLDYALVMLDPAGRVRRWNRGAERIHGHESSDMLGQPVSALYPQASAVEDAACDLRRASEAGRLEQHEWRLRKDGTTLWAHVITTPIRDETSALCGYAQVTRDLTAQRSADEALMRSEGRLRLLTDAVQDYAIYMLDLEGRVSTWNAGAERIKGYRPHEILGRHYAVFFPPEDVASGAPIRELEEALTTGHFEQEGYRLRRDGSRFWASVVLTPVRNGEDQVVGFAKVTRDLTKKRAAEEALERSEERLRLLIESVQDYAIYVLDPSGHVSSWNTGAERIKGYAAHEIVGRHYRQFFPEEDVRDGKPEEELEIARTAGRFEQEGWRVRKDGGRFWASVVLTPMRDAQGKLVGFAKVTRDLTQRRAAEETERELLREQTARAAAEHAEARLRESERRYRLLSERLSVILNGIADGITVSDANGALTFANRAALHMGRLGSHEELMGIISASNEGRYALFDETGARLTVEDLPQHRVHAGRPSASRVVRVLDQLSQREYWCDVRATAVPDEHGVAAVSVWHDVTEDRRRERHERHLAAATASLAMSLDYHTTLPSLAETLVPGLADFCAVHVLEDDALHVVATAHAHPAQAEDAAALAALYPPDRSVPHGVWHVLQTGKHAVHRSISDEALRACARDDSHAARLRALNMKSALIVPIRAGARALGTLTLVSSHSPERFDEREVALAEELARRVGQAIENARAYATTRAARDRLALLAKAGEALAAAHEYEQVLGLVLLHALPALGDFAFLDVREGDDVRRIARAHADDALEPILTEASRLGSPLDLDAPPGPSAYRPVIDDAFRAQLSLDPAQRAIVEGTGLCSMLRVPLVGRSGLFGALTVCFGKSGRHHTVDDLRLAEELARRAAVALERARLHASVQAAADEAAQAARQAEDSARRAEMANRVKDEFLATVSHELRTPLNAILGYASLMRGQVEPAFTNAVEVIHRNALAQAKLIEDILDVSRIVAGSLRLELGVVDVRDVARDALQAVRLLADAKRIEVSFESPPQPCLVRGDEARLQQVVWNLLSNAIKFSDSGTQVAMSLTTREGRVELSVRDRGKGIDSAFLPLVFEPFRQAESSTTRRYGGLGLGLAIVKHLVEQHGGRIDAQSAGIGLGAVFTVSLPAHDDARLCTGSAQDESAARADEGALAGRTILIVEDDLDTRDLLCTLLEHAGARVEGAASAEEARSALMRMTPDAIVSDVGMPGEDGYALMRSIRQLAAPTGRIPALVLTAYASIEDAQRARDAGFDAHLTKPVDPDALLRTLRALIEPP